LAPFVDIEIEVKLKFAVTFFCAFIVTVQEPAPEHAPDQPAKVEPAAAVAVSVILELPLSGTTQLTVQIIPGGELVTWPEPVPALAKLRVALVTPQTTLV